MFNLSITPDLLSYVLAGLCAILFDWFPVLSSWYGALSQLKKRQIMATVLLVIILTIYLGSCTGIFSTGLTCDKAGFAVLFQIYLVAIGINQGVHLLTKPGKEETPALIGYKGQGMVEYSLILVLVAIVVIAALTISGPLVKDIFITINGAL